MRSQYGAALAKKGRLEEAMGYYQKRWTSNPTGGTSLNLVTFLRQTGQVDDAIAQFQKALQIRPDYKEAHVNLATLLQQKGEVTKPLLITKSPCKSSPTTWKPTSASPML